MCRAEMRRAGCMKGWVNFLGLGGLDGFVASTNWRHQHISRVGRSETSKRVIDSEWRQECSIVMAVRDAEARRF